MINAEVLGKLELQPGDILGIQLNTEMSYMSVDELKRLREDIERLMPEGVKALILPSGTALYTTTREVMWQRIADVIDLALGVGPDDAKVAANAVLEGLHT